MEVATLLKILLDNNEVFIAPEEAVQQQSDDRHRMYIFNRYIYLEHFVCSLASLVDLYLSNFHPV